MDEKNKPQRGATPEPAESGRDSQQHEQKSKEGDYRNAKSQEPKVGSRQSAADSKQTEADNDASQQKSSTTNDLTRD